MSTLSLDETTQSRARPLTPARKRELALRAIHGAYLGNRLGDALGLPFEGMTRSAIQEREGGRVRAFRSPCELRSEGPWKITGGIGTTSDDWELTVAMNRAMIRMALGPQQFVPRLVAQELIDARQRSSEGWGPTTVVGVCGLKRFFKTNGERGFSGLTPVPITKRAPGRGNGAALRVAPLVFAGQMLEWVSGGTTTAEVKSLVSHCFRSAWMTHGHPVAWVGALLLTHALHQEFTERRNGFPLVPPTALVDRLRILRTFWQSEAEEFLLASNMRTYIGAVREAFDEVLRPLERLAKAGFSELMIDHIIAITGTESASDQSVPLAVALYLRHPNDPEAALCEAASVGGDTDSIAAMVGLLVGARNGPDAFPPWMRVHEGDAPRHEAIELVNACLP